MHMDIATYNTEALERSVIDYPWRGGGLNMFSESKPRPASAVVQNIWSA